jgi:predicted ATP-grasp superfamily ATP-dependent carboligase
VVAADAFCDSDTRDLALSVLQLRYADGGFDAAELRRLLLPRLTPDIGFVYGSGFETQPELLDEIALHGQVFGNTARTVKMVKHPDRFFALLADLGITYPDTSLSPPDATAGWLCKRAGGSGGVHVTLATQGRGGDCYFQRQVPGRACSLLFLADGRHIVVVGYNEQCLAPAPGTPFRYGGAVSQVRLPAPARAAMYTAACRITSASGLRGLNSLDCIVHDEQIWVLEVNPRLSATFSLYDTQAAGANLFDAHLQACAGQLAWRAPEESARAHLIYYAPFSITIPPVLSWPPWVADVPMAGSVINTGEPLCSIMASAADADHAMALARQRALALQEQLKTF